jgi:hypothetical protein
MASLSNLIFTVKGQSLHKWSTFQVPYSWVGSCLNTQTLHCNALERPARDQLDQLPETNL